MGCARGFASCAPVAQSSSSGALIPRPGPEHNVPTTFVCESHAAPPVKYCWEELRPQRHLNPPKPRKNNYANDFYRYGTSGMAQWLARWAHNAKVPGWKPGSATSRGQTFKIRTGQCGRIQVSGPNTYSSQAEPSGLLDHSQRAEKSEVQDVPIMSYYNVFKFASACGQSVRTGVSNLGGPSLALSSHTPLFHASRSHFAVKREFRHQSSP